MFCLVIQVKYINAGYRKVIQGVARGYREAYKRLQTKPNEVALSQTTG